MITSVRIQNYRSFVDAEVKLRPFSLVVGANGSGKSNLVRLFHGISTNADNPSTGSKWQKHINLVNATGRVSVGTHGGDTFEAICEGGKPILFSRRPLWANGLTSIFNLVPSIISLPESITRGARVKGDGSGTTQVLEYLKNGDREDLFDQIEENFKRYVPEVEKLSLLTTEEGKKQIQIREKGLSRPLPAPELSEGTRLVLCILTILHQQNPPPIILLEDIDRGLHPRLFEYVAPMMKDIAERHQINILATTHNPYLVDCFQDDKEAVIIVEKKDGASTLSTLADRLEGLDYDKEDPEDMPLGNLWFSGLVGGVPRKINSRVKE